MNRHPGRKASADFSGGAVDYLPGLFFRRRNGAEQRAPDGARKKQNAYKS
jgi:hypothetical protein